VAHLYFYLIFSLPKKICEAIFWVHFSFMEQIAFSVSFLSQLRWLHCLHFKITCHSAGTACATQADA